MDRGSIKAAVLAAITPLKPADVTTDTPKDMLFCAKRTAAGRNLPRYYLVYFLLVDLLGFKNLGQFEKVAWSIPVDFNGRAFFIEHRKFGLGIFDPGENEATAEEIALRIREAVTIAEPYFEWLADQAADGSSLNVVNKASQLYDRHRFFADQYEAKRIEAEARKDEQVRTKYENGFGIYYPTYQIKLEAKWLALSTIETFFSWTEHIFIHIGILNGNLLTGRDVRRAANSNWFDKFELALDLSNHTTQIFYDELRVIRKQIRNFDAHGSFGKQREAFSFHSNAGAVPLRLPHQRNLGVMRFGHGVDFVDHDAIVIIERFIEHLWSGVRAPAKIYIQESFLPLILNHANDGTYSSAMTDEKTMEDFCEHLNYLQDQHANMDF